MGTRLYDLATVIRSKNAGPYTLTIDLFVASVDTLDRIVAASAFTQERIAGLYGVSPDEVRIHPEPSIRAIKVSLPRPAEGMPDVYGAQQHFPLAEIEID